MEGYNQLIEIVFYVALLTIIGLAITFTILFILYASYKKKHIKYGHEDEKLLKELIIKYKHLFKGEKFDISTDKVNSTNNEIKCISKIRNVETYLYYHPDIEDKDKRRLAKVLNIEDMKDKKRKKISYIFSFTFLFIFTLLFSFIISFKVQNDAFFIGDKTYIVIKTGSMEEANEKNTYIKENNLNNQINRFSLISIQKIDEKKLNLYDVVAFKNDEGEIIVHRLVRINYNSAENKNYYTFQGDANTSSAKYEIAVHYEDIIGRYTGFNNFGLGVLITYLKSSAGIVALSSCFIFLIAFNISESSIEKEYKLRFKEVANTYDNKKIIGDLK